MLFYNKLFIFIIPIILITTINLFQYVFAATFQDYFNSGLGFGVRYPTDWEIRENVDSGAVYFIAPLPNDQSVFVLIAKEKLNHSNATLEEIKNAAILDNSTNRYPSVTLVDVNDKDYSLGGYPAIRIETIMDLGIVKYKTIMFGTIIYNYYYTFMINSDISNFDSYASIFQGMLSSLWIEKLEQPSDIKTISVRLFLFPSDYAQSDQEVRIKLNNSETGEFASRFLSVSIFGETATTFIVYDNNIPKGNSFSICIENLEHNKEDCKKVTREYEDSINVNVKVP